MRALDIRIVQDLFYSTAQHLEDTTEHKFCTIASAPQGPPQYDTFDSAVHRLWIPPIMGDLMGWLVRLVHPI